MSGEWMHGVEVLDRGECWFLLRGSLVGRLAISIANHPDIFPINYVVDHGTIVFRTAEGTKLAGAVLGPSVAFEVDGFDIKSKEAWSVVVKGRAAEIKALHELFDAADLPLFPWLASPKHCFVRIVPDEVTGRRFRVVDEPTGTSSVQRSSHE
jgi:nitroimidazol reductase NimA-like FMN-containing flavoprotein (pyridoxamine 5'-phosphate oxidase superfamily)